MSDIANNAGGGTLPLRPVLTLEVARRMVSAAEAKARQEGLAVSIAVVDQGGHLVEFSRMDGLHVGTIDVATAKARAAALFKKPTTVFAEALEAGAKGLLALPGMLPMPGGVPVFCESVLVGAVGISGATPQQDAEMAGIAAAVAPTTGETR